MKPILCVIVILLLTYSCAKKNPIEKKTPPPISPTCGGAECISFMGMSDDGCEDYAELPSGARNKSVVARVAKATHKQPIYLLWKVEKLNPDGTIYDTTPVQKTNVSGTSKLNCLYEKIGNSLIRLRLLPLCASNNYDSAPDSCGGMSAEETFSSGYSPTVMLPHGTTLLASLEGTIIEDHSRVFELAATVGVGRNVIATNAPSDCEIACNAFENRCFSRRAKSGPPDSLRKMSDLIKNSSGTSIISTKAIRQVFGVPDEEDGCKRGDLLIKKSTLRNQGERCEISSAVADGNSNEGVSVFIPEQLEATYDADINGFDVLFTDSRRSPELVFSSKDLQSVLGGTIKRMTLSKSVLFVATNNSCLRISQ